MLEEDIYTFVPVFEENTEHFVFDKYKIVFCNVTNVTKSCGDLYSGN